MSKPLRETMPETAAFIDAMRAAFGADSVNQSIREGMAGSPSFYAEENGQQIGTKLPEARRVVTGDQLVVGSINVAVKNGRR